MPSRKISSVSPLRAAWPGKVVTVVSGGAPVVTTCEVPPPSPHPISPSARMIGVAPSTSRRMRGRSSLFAAPSGDSERELARSDMCI